MKIREKKILIVAVGTSPSVLTETVWALACEHHVIPDEVIALTTETGRQKLREEILSGPTPVWNKLRAALKKKEIDTTGKLNFGSSSSILVFSKDSRDLNDITTPEENTCAADFILKTIRSYSEDPSAQIYASIAGGRKTMSALMLSCMSLLARENDRVLHVLVNTPFDGGVEPTFYFPDASKYKTRTKPAKTLSGSQAKIDLIDLPFVKVRGLYEEKFESRVPSYSELVEFTQQGISSIKPERPTLSFDVAKGILSVNSENIDLSAVEFMVLLLALYGQNCTGIGHLCKRISTYYTKPLSRKLSIPKWLDDFQSSSRFETDDDDDKVLKSVTKILSDIRKKLAKNKACAPFVSELLPKGFATGSQFPRNRISADVKKFSSYFGS